MKLDDKKIKMVLLDGNYVSEEDIQEAEKFAKSTQSSIIEYLLNQQLITSNLIGQAIAESLDVPYIDLNAQHPDHKTIMKLPEGIARKYRMLAVKESEKEVHIATDDPLRKGMKEEVQKLFKGKKVVTGYALSDDVEKLFAHYRRKLDIRFNKIFETSSRIAPDLMNEIFEDAVINTASDIHLEPHKEEVVVRLLFQLGSKRKTIKIQTF